MFDRDAAREVLEAMHQPQAINKGLLDALAGCVRPVPPKDDPNGDAVEWRARVADGMGYLIPETGQIADAAVVIAAFKEAEWKAWDYDEGMRPVPPQTIDRDHLIGQLRLSFRGFTTEQLTSAADRILALVVPDSRFDTIRALHYKVGFNTGTWCHECRDPWPCATIRALDGKTG